MSARSRSSRYLFTWPARVYYEDTDAGGVVFYANYLKYLERARTEWLRSIGISQQQLVKEMDALFAVVNIQGNYRKPARLDDALTVTVDISGAGRSSLTFIQEIRRDADDLLLFDGSVKVACLTSAFKPRSIPEEIRKHFG